MKYCCTILFCFFALAAWTQDDCYKILYDKGLTAYQAGRYAEALKKWEAAATCPDKPTRNDLDSRIGQAKAKLKPRPDSKPVKKPSVPTTTPSGNASDDELWDIVRDSKDSNTVQKYLDQYPNGRHAYVAGFRIKEIRSEFSIALRDIPKSPVFSGKNRSAPRTPPPTTVFGKSLMTPKIPIP